MNGLVTNLFVKPGHRLPMVEKSEIELIAGKGIIGDRSFGRSSRQILLVDQAVVKSYALQPGWLRENLTVRDADLGQLESGNIIAVGDCQLEVVGECTPCSRLDEIRDGLQSEIEGDRGVLARVIVGGKVQVGDPVSLTGA